MLEHDFELLIQMERLWPSLKWSMSRLRAFHRACRANMHSSFDMSHWLLVFLQRFGLSVEKENETGAGFAIEPLSTRQDDFLAPHDVFSSSDILGDLTGDDILRGLLPSEGSHER